MQYDMQNVELRGQIKLKAYSIAVILDANIIKSLNLEKESYICWIYLCIVAHDYLYQFRFIS